MSDSLSNPDSASASEPTPRPAPQMPPSMIVLLPALVCVWWGSTSFGDGTFSITAPSGLVGGGIGLLLGLAVYLDNRAMQQRIEKSTPSIALDPKPVIPPASVADTQSKVIGLIMLGLPLVAGILIWQREMLQLTTQTVRLLGCATVLSTATLGYYDLRRLVLRSRGVSPSGSQPVSPPVATFLGMVVLWVLAYPAHFLARRRLGAANLVVPALVATVVFLSPIVMAWFSKPSLPAVGSPDVVALVEKIIEESPFYRAKKDEIGKFQVREPIEVSFDQERQRRVARAKIASKLGEQEIFYTVEWKDRKKEMFAVQVFDEKP